MLFQIFPQMVSSPHISAVENEFHNISNKPLKGTVSRDFRLLVFSWISFPQSPEYTMRAVSNFFENSRTYSQLKVCHRCQRYRWLIATGVVDTGGKFATGINNTRENGGKICHRCRWYRWQFAAGVVDTDGKFATCVVDTGGAPWLANISANFWKNSKRS